MKVEASKNNAVDRKENKNVFKTEKSVFNTTDSLKPVNTPTSGAFAKILEETRREKDQLQTAKTDSGDADTKLSRSERDEKLERAADEKREPEEHDGKNSGSDTQQNNDEQQAQQTLLNSLIHQNNTGAEPNVPASRSILHVADLERIVATIRTENFQNRKQVTIALKNSVLQGLQIKLTLTENGKVKAEFLAGSDQVKKQLQQRSKELSEILGNRSALFSEVGVISSPADTN